MRQSLLATKKRKAQMQVGRGGESLLCNPGSKEGERENKGDDSKWDAKKGGESSLSVPLTDVCA